MGPDPRDLARLADMLQAAQAVLRFVGGRSRDDYSKDEVLRSAVERKIEVIGEAARMVSAAFADAHPEIEWQKIRATRHILIHEYGRVDDEIVWRIATVHVPELIALLTPLITEPPMHP